MDWIRIAPLSLIFTPLQCLHISTSFLHTHLYLIASSFQPTPLSVCFVRVLCFVTNRVGGGGQTTGAHEASGSISITVLNATIPSLSTAPHHVPPNTPSHP